MGAPKALLDAGGETILDHLIAAFSSCCSPVVVVLGYHAEQIRAGIRRARQAEFVLNPHPERGQLSSLQCGLRAVPEDAEGVIFTPVDYPNLQFSTLARLAEAFHAGRGDALVTVPSFRGKHGHPVCIARELIPDLLQLPQGSRAREIIHRNVDHTCYVEVDDPGILHDADDPEAYRRLVKQNPNP